MARSAHAANANSSDNTNHRPFHAILDMNAVIGTFPSVPSYATKKYFSDANCKEYTFGEAMLLNACLQTSSTTSVKYTCSKSEP